MKLQNLVRNTVCPMMVLLAMGGLNSCDEDSLHLGGTDCSIMSLSLKSGDQVLPVRIYPDSMVVVADYNQSMTDMTAVCEISEGATVKPDMATVTDWSGPLSFTVTSAAKDNQKVYKYTVQREALESYCKENVCLRTQAEVDEFAQHNYRRVRSLVISDSEDNQITDLSFLKDLYEVDYNVTVKGFHGETVAFDNLKSVSTIDVNDVPIANVSAPQLEEINNLYLGFISGEPNSSRELMDSLTNIDFSSLKHIKGDLKMRFWNPDPEFAIHGFDNVESIDGDISFRFPTAHFKTFSKLTKVNNLEVCNSVKSFEGLENIKEVTGTFSTYFLLSAKSILPFAPEKIHTIRLLNNQQIADLQFCKNLTKLHTLEIFGGRFIESLEGLENIREIEDGMKIQSTGLKNLDALTHLESVANYIRISSNRKLEDFSGLKNCLKSFKGEWDVRYNQTNPTIEEILAN